MKRFFVSTLTLLFAITCLFLTNGYSSSDSDYKADWIFDGVYGTALASVWYSEPFVSSHHLFSVSNDGPGGVKYYTTATMAAYWAGGGSVTPPPKERSDVVEVDGYAYFDEVFSFNLRDKPEGQGYAWASSAMEVRHIPTNEKRSLDTAHASITFDIL